MLTNVKARGITCAEILCIFVLKTKRGDQEAELPVARSQWGFGSGSPDAAAILQLFK